MLVLAFFVIGVPAQLPASVFQDQFNVGDIVEFEFLGQTLQGEVTKFTGTGWPYVQFEYRGRTMERFRPPDQLTLIESVEEATPETAMSKMRLWTDSTGAFTLTAKLLSNKNGKVELEKEDGRVITLPANKLSKDDQAYLKEIENDSNEENPFAGGEMKSKPHAKGGRTAATPKDSAPPAITPAATTNEIVLADNGWSVQPDAATTVGNNNKIIGFDSSFKKHAFHNRLSSTSFSGDKRFLATSVMNPFENASEIVVVDLVAGAARPPITIPFKECSLLAISPSGDQAVTFRKGKGREKGSVEFWRLGESAEKVSTWNAASFFDRNEFLPTEAHFVDESRLLTFGRRVILWDCETAAALYSFSVSTNSKPVLSAGSKQIAVGIGNSIFLVDTESGNSLGKIEATRPVELLAFSQNGQFLAGLQKSSGAIDVWDLGSGDLVQEMAAPNGQGTFDSLGRGKISAA